MRQITVLPVPSGQTHRTHCKLEDNEVEGVKMKRVRDKGGKKRRKGIEVREQRRDWRTKWQKEQKNRIGEGGCGGM